MNNIVIIGAGGHGRVVASIINTMPEIKNNLVGFIDNKKRHVDKLPILGNDDNIEKLYEEQKIGSFILGIGMVVGGENVRKKIFYKCKNIGLKPVKAIHPAAIIDSFVYLGEGIVVMPGAIINNGVKLEENSIVNTGAIIDHDCHISSNVHIAPGVTLSGGVKIGCNTLVGVGSCIKHNVIVGENVTIGAGSVVVNDIPSNCVVVGNPARLLKT